MSPSLSKCWLTIVYATFCINTFLGQWFYICSWASIIKEFTLMSITLHHVYDNNMTLWGGKGEELHVGEQSSNQVDCNQHNRQASRLLVSSWYVNYMSPRGHVVSMGWIGGAILNRHPPHEYMDPISIPHSLLAPMGPSLLTNHCHLETQVSWRAHIVDLCSRIVLLLHQINLHMSYVHAFSIPHVTPKSIVIAFIYLKMG